MRHRRSLHPLIALAGLCLSPALLAQNDCADLEGLSWMLGSWQVEKQGTEFRERWTREPSGRFGGEADSRKAGEEAIIQREVMSIEPRSGGLAYVVDVNADGDPVVFDLVVCEETSARFENPDHDFPNRLDYRRTEDGRLKASVTDLEGNGFELEFRAVEAPASGD